MIKQLMYDIGYYAQERALGALDDYVTFLDKKLIASGNPGGWKGLELFGAQICTAIIFPVFWVFVLKSVGVVDFLFEGPIQLLVYIGLIAFGFMFPGMNVDEKMKKRQKAITIKLPDTLDLLTISVEAGLDFLTAIRRVMERLHAGPLYDELERFFSQLELGKPRAEALREMADRVQLQDMTTVVSSLIQADRLGSSVGPVLRIQSDMLRIRRAQRAEKAAQEAPVKILAPLMICILPSVFIMILAPIFIQMIHDVGKNK